MTWYYLTLAVRNFRKSPILTLLMVVAISAGVAASMTTLSLIQAASRDPAPTRSSVLFFPLIDSAGPEGRSSGNEPPPSFPYSDAMALMRDHRAARQTALYPVSLVLRPLASERRPRTLNGHAVYSDFFAMTDAPFQFGAAWGAMDDDKSASVVVIGNRLNEQLFGGKNSVGHEITLGQHAYRVIGVLKDWNPQPLFYDLANGSTFGTEDQFFIPMTSSIAGKIQTAGPFVCSSTLPANAGFDGILSSNCTWISIMVELRTAEERAKYDHYLRQYSGYQRDSGRFNWPPNYRLRGLLEWLEFAEVVPSDARYSFVVSALLLLVCIVTTTGLLFAKFLQKTADMTIRRALGARSVDIAKQCFVEAGTIGLFGGVLAIALTLAGVSAAKRLLPDELAPLVHVDIGIFTGALLLSVMSTLLAGILPVVRMLRLQPSMQIKQN